ncbi:hypothetical protein V6U77_12180 [Micromonospora sp. CPCC 205546]|uniref:hypothetical protein n=1 Tax=Micromonospora sp. CPCC 205546 TaxID=3122397 RepID=UPI002FF1D818
MNFLQLQQRLRAAGHDPFQAYAGHYDTLRGQGRAVGRSMSMCYGAWNLLIEDGRYIVTVRDLHRPARFPPDTHGPEPVVFDSEQAACEELWAIVSRLDPPGSVRAVTADELDPVAVDWLRECGWWPPATLYGNPFVATGERMSYRIAERDGRFELHLRDHGVAKLGDPVHAADDLADVTRVLLTEVGNRDAPRPQGWPRVGFRAGWAGEEDLSALRALDLAAITRAYRTECPGPPLRILAEGPDLSLVTTELVELAERGGHPLRQFVSTRESVAFGVDVRYVIRRHHEPLRYSVDRYGERENHATTVFTAEDLAPIHEYLRQRFRR